MFYIVNYLLMTLDACVLYLFTSRRDCWPPIICSGHENEAALSCFNHNVLLIIQMQQAN